MAGVRRRTLTPRPPDMKSIYRGPAVGAWDADRLGPVPRGAKLIDQIWREYVLVPGNEITAYLYSLLLPVLFGVVFIVRGRRGEG